LPSLHGTARAGDPLPDTGEPLQVRRRPKLRNGVEARL